VTSIFFGGGTPSLMKPYVVESILNDIAKAWPIADTCEITLEANPTSVEVDKFKAFRAAGINRVSMGVQSFNEQDLKFLGREHNTSEAIRAIETAGDVFDRFSFDLIYARPGQSVTAWEEELRRALSLAKGHLSLYQLTIEEGTPFYMRHARGEFKIPDDALAGDLYEATQDILEGAGMPAYEISNHAAAGQESRHNLTYWRYTDYAGIGPGAHGRLTIDGTKYATRGHRAPDIWLSRVAEHGHGGHDLEAITPRDRFVECLMMGLRLTEGVPIQRLQDEGGQGIDELIPPEKITVLVREGLLICTQTHLIATKTGLQRLNGVLNYLL